MSSHQVIARKWRPQKFGDVVGQTHVIRTLRNAIAGNRVGHAYLLVGPRGIGKTTIARIFAKAINCENPRDGEPCCECSSCKALAAESSLDVIEIDAASRNSVEHMRALSEEAYHMPVASKYKIYIIDEVHMLSKAAWNALLKTVEEPPAHVKFIFATTEAHLVLPTIVSRCQRFDLRPIAGNLILGRLKMIAEAENVKIAPEALSAIARAAEGGMRDAQSSLEQMLAFFGGSDREIAAEQVLELFGLTNAVELDTLLAAMLQDQPGPVVTIVNQLAGRGRNLETLFDDILEMLRGAELMQILNDPGAVLDFDDEKLERCRKLSALTSAEVLRCFMENLSPVGRVLHEALNKAIYLESILLKAMHEAHAPTVGDVLNRLNQLRGAGELNFVDQVPSFQQQPKALAMPVVLPEAAPRMPEPAVAPATMPAPAPEPAAAPEPIPVPTVEAEAVKEVVAEPLEVVEAAPVPAPVIEPEVVEPAPAPVEEVVPPAPPVVEKAIEPAPAPAVEAEAEDSLGKLWSGLVAEIKQQSPECPVENCRALSVKNSVLSIEVPQSDIADIRAARMLFLAALQKLTGDWAMLVDFQVNQTADAATAPAPVMAPVVEDIPPAVEEYSAPEFTPPPEKYDPPPAEFTAPLAEISNNAYQAPAEEVQEFIDLNVEENEYADEEAFMRQELEFIKRSVINKPEEIEATAKIPAVQKVLQLFDGEIVDIHA